MRQTLLLLSIVLAATACGPDEPVDPCAVLKCGAGATCTEGACACDDGLAGDPTTGCFRTCETTTCDAGQVCVGGVTADATCEACPSGFTSAGGATACTIDLDECEAGTATCTTAERCINAAGGFDCEACPSGFVSAGKGAKSCTLDVDECEAGTATCTASERCINTAGAFDCAACPRGFASAGGGATSCGLDLDECELGTATCTTAERCINTVGAFDCAACPDGFASAGGGDTSCALDLDECGLGTATCSTTERCENTVGGFDCRACPSGFSSTGGGGTLCAIDLDECGLGTATCTMSERCVNTVGGFDCEPCPSGFASAGGGAASCSFDLDECAAGTATCTTSERCINTSGAFDCAACPSGFTSAGSGATSCDVDIDECAEGTATCTTSERCVNTVGAFDCAACPSGFTSAGGGATSCDFDVDECAVALDDCALYQGCENTPGTFECFALLSNLTPSAGTFAFEPGTTEYAFEVGFLVTTLALQPEAGPGVAVTVDGLPVASGEGSAPRALTLGDNAFVVEASAGGRAVAYTLTVTRAAPRQSYLKASNAGVSDNFGYSSAVDGDTLVVGAPHEDGNAASTIGAPNDLSANAGAVYVFTRQAGTWSQQAYLKASNAGAGDLFGYSVALDGDTLVVGAHAEDGNVASTAGAPNDLGENAGAAYVFTRTDGTWTQEAYLKASNAAPGDFFGHGVALDGDTLAVGAYSEDGNAASTAAAPNDLASNAGAAYVFTRTAGAWSQQAYLKAVHAGAGDTFGYSIALDGDTIVVGAQGEDGNAASTVDSPNELVQSAGAAYVFTRTGDVWSQQAYLKAANAGASDLFGISVALDGGTVLVGAYSEDGSAASTTASPNDASENAGAAYVFTRVNNTWSQQAYLKAANAGAGDGFGYVVALNGDTIVVGASGEDGSAASTAEAPDDARARAGAAYVFIRTGDTWSQQAYLKAANADAGDGFGHSVAFDGVTLVLGASYEDGNAASTAASPNNLQQDAGAAYVVDF